MLLVMCIWFIRFAFKKKRREKLPRPIPVVMNPWRPISTNSSTNSTKQDLT
jgi:hypothetical protein